MKFPGCGVVIAVCLLSMLACSSNPESATRPDEDAAPAAEAKSPRTVEPAKPPDPQSAKELAANWLNACKEGNIDYLMKVTTIPFQNGGKANDEAATRQFYEQTVKSFGKKNAPNWTPAEALTKAEYSNWLRTFLNQIGEQEEYKQQSVDQLLEILTDQDLLVVLLDKSKAGLNQLGLLLLVRGSGSDLRLVQVIK